MDRGRAADSPAQIPGPGWRDIAWRVWHRFSDEHVMLAAAGVAFFIILAFVPTLAALVAIYGLVFDPSEVLAQIDGIAYLLPADFIALLRDQLMRLTSSPEKQLGIAAAVAFALALFSASSATKGIVEGLNLVYAEREKRSWLMLTLLAIVLTVAGILCVIAFLAGSVLLPKLLETAGVGSTALPLVASYAFLAVFISVVLAAIYRWAPSRSEAKFVWLAPGSLFAVVMLLAFSAAFSWFVRTFGTYSAYGSLSVVIATMTWLWISMVIILLGAQINAEAEHQTAKDSTTGAPLPMGTRGAVMADTLGPTAGRDFSAPVPRPRRAVIQPAEVAVIAVLSVAALALLWQQRTRR
jgi:membrane protein